MINIVYCGNKAVAGGMYISMLSIVKHTKEPITFHIVTMDLLEVNSKYSPVSSKQIKVMDELLKLKNNNIILKIYEISELYKEVLSIELAKKSIYTPYSLLRLCLDLLPLKGKVLYLDTDTVANKDISELYNIDMTNLEAAACMDFLGRIFLKYKKWKYVNSGVMLYNLDVIRETKLFEKCRYYVLHKKAAFLDQDALNKLMTKKIIIDSKYNRQNGYSSDCVIQHFSKTLKSFPYIHTQNIKPWHVDKVHSVLKIHAYDEILNNYLNNKEKLEA